MLTGRIGASIAQHIDTSINQHINIVNQPNQRGGGGGFRQAQQASPLAIRTKKTQFDTNTYTRLAMAEVWKKDWVYALIPFALGLLPAIFVHSWWWLVLAAVLTLLFVLFRSAQALAYLQGRNFAIPADFKTLAVPVFAHRVVVDARYASTLKKAEQSDQLLKEVVESVAVPV